MITMKHRIAIVATCGVILNIDGFSCNSNRFIIYSYFLSIFCIIIARIERALSPPGMVYFDQLLPK